MRCLRKTFSIIVPLGLMVLAGLPAAALADGTSNRAWMDSGEFVGYDDEDFDRHVTVEVSGNLDFSGVGGQVNCDVTGEIEVWNDWQGGEPTWSYQDASSPLETPARNAVTSLETAGSPSTACHGSLGGSGSCALSSVTFSGLPWTGETSAWPPFGSASAFAGATVAWTWAQCGGGGAQHSDTIRITTQNLDCLEGFEVVEDYFGSFHIVVSGSLEIDAIEGLSPGDPCLLLW